LSGNEKEAILEKYFENYEPAAQQKLIEVMLNVVLSQEHAHWIALVILEKRATIEHRRKIHELYLSKLKPAMTWQDEWYLQMLIDALSYETTDEFVNTIEEFLLFRPYGQSWTRPCDELLKTHPTLYLRGWTRFFKESTFEKGKTNIIFQGFIKSPDAILGLKQYMIINDPNVWGKFKTVLLYTADVLSWPPQEMRDKSKQVILS
jgi:hypothetical protein